MNSKSLVVFSVALLCTSLFGLSQCGGGGRGQIPVTTSSSSARESFAIGAELFDNLRLPEAQKYFKKAIDADPEFALAYLFSALSNPSAKGFFDNIQLAAKYSGRASKAEQTLIDACMAGANGDPSTQTRLLQQLAEQFPKDRRALLFLASQYFNLQQYDSAISVCERIVQLAPSYAPPYNLLGYAYRFVGNMEAAGRSFREYIRLIPDDPNPYDSYAELLMHQDRFEAAIEQYREALRHDRTFGASRIGISANLIFLGRYDEARRELQVLIDSAVTTGQRRAGILGMVVSFVDEGNLEMGLAKLNELYEFDASIPDPATMSADLGSMMLLLVRLGRFEEAGKRLAQAIEVVDKSDLFARIKKNTRQDAYLSQAMILREQGRLSEARQKAEAYLTEVEPLVNPGRLRNGYLSLGLISLAEKNYDQAISDMDQADQSQAWTLYHLAMAYEGKGDTAKAAELYLQAAQKYELNSIPYALIRQNALRRAEALQVKPVG